MLTLSWRVYNIIYGSLKQREFISNSNCALTSKNSIKNTDVMA